MQSVHTSEWAMSFLPRVAHCHRLGIQPLIKHTQTRDQFMTTMPDSSRPIYPLCVCVCRLGTTYRHTRTKALHACTQHAVDTAHTHPISMRLNARSYASLSSSFDALGILSCCCCSSSLLDPSLSSEPSSSLGARFMRCSARLRSCSSLGARSCTGACFLPLVLTCFSADGRGMGLPLACLELLGA